MKDLDVAVLRSVSAIAGLCDGWEALSAPFATPLLDHDWFLSAAESLHDERDLRVVVVRRSGRLVAVAPLALDPSRRRLVLLGASALYEPGGVLFASEHALKALMLGVAALGDTAILSRCAPGIAAAPAFRGTLRTRGVTAVRPSAPSYGVRTERPWPEYLRSLSGRTRRQLDALRERAARLAARVHLEEVTPTSVTVDALFDQLIATEHAGWKGRGGSSLSARVDLERFFRRYARRVSAKQLLRVTLLRIGHDVAAVEFAVQVYGRRWGLKLGYDERFAQCAPAIQVVHASIRAAVEQGLSSYEFLGSAEPWQERWKPEPRAYVTTVFYPLRIRAFVTAVQDVTGVLTRSLKPTRNAAL